LFECVFGGTFIEDDVIQNETLQAYLGGSDSPIKPMRYCFKSMKFENFEIWSLKLMRVILQNQMKP